ncbi:Bypass of stop codon protein 6 [Grifola frondosa]|uniref:Bypass of stop codon protein 6 n=1 Tax=Grifola frondosa TaxID=5627 RepID=A0A1C7LT40_GRIFR|nr:Bypass of stop codon protein 6 [Grifola frondosa]
MSSPSAVVPVIYVQNEANYDTADDSVKVFRAAFSGKNSGLPALESALNVDTGTVSSLALPATLTSDRLRRRSELSRIRPLGSLPSTEPESIELPVLSRIEENEASRARTTVVVLSGGDSFVKAGEMEMAPSFPSSIATSVRYEEETSSTAPVISPAQKAIYRWKSRMHFAALCYSFFLEGWNDGSTGPLLPTIQRFYGIGFAIVSLLFVFGTIGFISGAFSNVYLNDRFGFGKVLVIGSVFQLAAYAFLSPAGPFPLMCLGFACAGFGISLQNAQANGFVGSLKEHARTKMGLLHASYGFGALLSPLVATHFSTTMHWSFHYLISAGIGLTNTATLWYVFRLKNQDDVMAEAGGAAGEADTANQNKYRQILGIKEVHFLSLFSLIYVGVEVTLGGWIVTFVQEKRGGNSNAGYISSGFFGGLMLGRILLMWLNRKIGERRVLFIYAFLAIQLEVTIWVVPSLVENAFAVACIGLLLGPMYPILMNHSTTILPKWLLTGCLGYIAGFGQAGSAVLPFVTGLLASKFGIGALQPFIVSMMSTMMVIWVFIPRVRRVD